MVQNFMRPTAPRLAPGVVTGDFYSSSIVNAINSAAGVAQRQTITVGTLVANTLYTITVADKAISINSAALTSGVFAAAIVSAFRTDRVLNSYGTISNVGALITFVAAPGRTNLPVSISTNAPSVFTIAQTVAPSNPSSIPFGRLCAINAADAAYAPNVDGLRPVTLFTATAFKIEGISVADQAGEKARLADGSSIGGVPPYKELSLFRVDEIVVELDAPIAFVGAVAPPLFARFAAGPGGLYADKIGCLSAISDAGTRALAASESMLMVGPSFTSADGLHLAKVNCLFR